MIVLSTSATCITSVVYSLCDTTILLLLKRSLFQTNTTCSMCLQIARTINPADFLTNDLWFDDRFTIRKQKNSHSRYYNIIVLSVVRWRRTIRFSSFKCLLKCVAPWEIHVINFGRSVRGSEFFFVQTRERHLATERFPVNMLRALKYCNRYYLSCTCV